MLKVLNVVGARPNFMKIAPIIAVINRRPSEISQFLVHTGQHYDQEMSEAFFRDLRMPEPDVNLNVGSGTHAGQTAHVMLAFEPVLLKYRPDWVVVVGDVNSTLACALVATKLGVKVAHVEAGLRSYDWNMPEEVNRVLTDRISDLLLTPSADAKDNLLREGLQANRIHCVGNVMIDTLFSQLERAKERDLLARLALQSDTYAVMTLHRPSNVDNPMQLKLLFEVLSRVSRLVPIIFPAHPRTQARLKEFNIPIPGNIKLLDPLSYLDFLQLWSQAKFVLTDSGGLQEETSALGIPCLTLRDSTERPITITHGTNRLVGTNPECIELAIQELMDCPPLRKPCQVELWDGHASERIITGIISSSRSLSAQAQSGS